jgi:hypothetical protein
MFYVDTYPIFGVVYRSEEKKSAIGIGANLNSGESYDDVHIDMAVEILKAMLKPAESVEYDADCFSNVDYSSECPLSHSFRLRLIPCAEDDKKALVGFITRIDLPETLDDDKVRTLKMLVRRIFMVCSRPSTYPLFLSSFRSLSHHPTLLSIDLISCYSVTLSQTPPPPTPSRNLRKTSRPCMLSSWRISQAIIRSGGSIRA